MFPAVQPSALEACCLLVLLSPLTAQGQNTLFDKIDPNLLRFGILRTCDSVTLRTLSSLDPLSCARQCSSEASNVAFLWNEADRHCSLLSSPCKPPSLKSVTQMMKRREHPSTLTWRFKKSKYIVLNETGSFAAMQRLCSRHGMYLWIPNTKEEAAFVEKEIMNSVLKTVWIGVVDKPNGNCLLSDYATKCPIIKYGGKEPSREDEECTEIKKEKSGWSWNDNYCDVNNGVLCEGLAN